LDSYFGKEEESRKKWKRNYVNREEGEEEEQHQDLIK